MSDIYRIHEKAFAQTSAYVVLRDNERVATLAFKFPRDGAGRLWVYAHWIGREMVRAYADGYGYDKRSAACNAAARKLASVKLPEWRKMECPYEKEAFEAFRAALIAGDEGPGFDRALRDAGFTVWQAV